MVLFRHIMLFFSTIFFGAVSYALQPANAHRAYPSMRSQPHIDDASQRDLIKRLFKDPNYSSQPMEGTEWNPGRSKREVESWGGSEVPTGLSFSEKIPNYSTSGPTGEFERRTPQPASSIDDGGDPPVEKCGERECGHGDDLKPFGMAKTDKSQKETQHTGKEWLQQPSSENLNGNIGTHSEGIGSLQPPSSLLSSPHPVSQLPSSSLDGQETEIRHEEKEQLQSPPTTPSSSVDDQEIGIDHDGSGRLNSSSPTATSSVSSSSSLSSSPLSSSLLSSSVPSLSTASASRVEDFGIESDHKHVNLQLSPTPFSDLMTQNDDQVNGPPPLFHDYANFDDMQPTTFDEEAPPSLEPSVPYVTSCEGRCGKVVSVPDCHCDLLCFVYQTCCSDIDLICPKMRGVAKHKFNPKLLGPLAYPTCDPNSRTFMITGCEDRTNLFLETIQEKRQGDTGSLFYYRLLRFIPVYDSHTNILYKDIFSFQCFGGPKSKPRFWQLEAGVWDLTNDGEVQDILMAFEHGDYLTKPLQEEFGGKLCYEEIARLVAPFSIIVDFKSSSRLELVFKTDFGYWLDTDQPSFCVAGKGYDVSCNETECNGQVDTTIELGNCTHYFLATLSFTHPPWIMDSEDIRSLAELIKCTVLSYDQPMDIVINEIETETPSMNARFDNYDNNYPDHSGVSESETRNEEMSPDYTFLINLGIETSLNVDIVANNLRHTVVFAFNCMGLVRDVTEFLEYIPQDNGLKQEYLMFPGVNPSKNCSAIGRKSLMTVSSASHDNEDIPSYVSLCLDVEEVTDTIGVENIDFQSYFMCQRKIFRSNLSDFNECVVETVGDAGPRPALTKSLVLWYILILFSMRM